MKIGEKKNSDSQKIAQNKPEQKIKNSLATKRSYTTERREKCSAFMKERWKNDNDFAEKAKKNIIWTQDRDDSSFGQRIKSSIGIGGLKGYYNGIRYESALELSYILWCNDNDTPIKRYDGEPIEYIDENNKCRLYIPDFIVNNSTIVEIKGHGLYYKRNFERNQLKLK